MLGEAILRLFGALEVRSAAVTVGLIDLHSHMRRRWKPHNYLHVSLGTCLLKVT